MYDFNKRYCCCPRNSKKDRRSAYVVSRMGIPTVTGDGASL